MGLVYSQFAQELESLQRKYADRPRDELIALCGSMLGKLRQIFVSRPEQFPISPAGRQLG